MGVMLGDVNEPGAVNYRELYQELDTLQVRPAGCELGWVGPLCVNTWPFHVFRRALSHVRGRFIAEAILLLHLLHGLETDDEAARDRRWMAQSGDVRLPHKRRPASQVSSKHNILMQQPE